MQAVVIYESLTGNTKRAASMVAAGLNKRGIDTTVFPVTSYNPDVVAAADLVVLGTWTDGFILVGQRPGRLKRFADLPDLSGKRCAVFVTYAVNPGKAIERFQNRVVELGGEVIGGMEINRGKLTEGADELADRISQVAGS